MKFKYLVATSVAALLTVSSANAADLRRDMRPTSVVLVAPTFSWEGGYAGLQLGYASTEYTAKASKTAAQNSPADRELKHKRSAFPVGLFAGYNSSYNSFLVGAEVDAQYYFLRKLGTDSKAVEGFTDVADVKNQVNVALRARLGMAVGKALPYVAAGLTGTYMNRDFAAVEKAKAGPRSKLEEGGMSLGWTLGAGVDVALANNMLLRVEYRYNHMGEQSWVAKGAVANQDDQLYTVMENPAATSSELRLGLGFKY